jgi:phosphoheptose isomerase
MRDLVREHIERSIHVKKLLIESQLDAIGAAGDVLCRAMAAGKTLFTCGNGGSAGDAQHIATELLIRYRAVPERRSLPALSLVGDACAVTAAGNDFGFEFIFSRQLEGMGREGDALLAISTSGNSRNILEALRTARAKGMRTVLMTGGSGGEIIRSHSNLVDAGCGCTDPGDSSHPGVSHYGGADLLRHD